MRFNCFAPKPKLPSNDKAWNEIIQKNPHVTFNMPNATNTEGLTVQQIYNMITIMRTKHNAKLGIKTDLTRLTPQYTIHGDKKGVKAVLLELTELQKKYSNISNIYAKLGKKQKASWVIGNYILI